MGRTGMGGVCESPDRICKLVLLLVSGLFTPLSTLRSFVELFSVDMRR